eukprot:GHRR01020022.1.p1 GENE.GHRR01020022.1~~GHRR01020022.1.p1  ORF type:complete len:675 (+),score=189.80 GHRR01020022.1:864-2888(+)
MFLIPVSDLVSSQAAVSGDNSSSSNSSNGNFSSSWQPAAIDVTPFKGVKASGILSDKKFPNKLYIGLNKRDPAVFDLYSFDMSTKQLTLDTMNPGEMTTWLLDYNFNVQGALAYSNDDGSSYVLIRDTNGSSINSISTSSSPGSTVRTVTASTAANQRGLLASQGMQIAGSTTINATTINTAGPPEGAAAAFGNYTTAESIANSNSGANVSSWRQLVRWPFGEEGGAFRFNKAGDALYLSSSIGRDTAAFQLVSTAPGAKVVRHLASDPLSDVGSVIFDPDTWEPELVAFNYLKTNWTVLDEALKSEWARIVAFRPNDTVAVQDRSQDKQKWLLLYGSDSKTSKYYLYWRGTWPPQLLFEVRPGLNNYTLARMNSVIITARDGLKLPAYLTLPVKNNVPVALPAAWVGAASVTNVSNVNKPYSLNLPMVLYVHGGPWARDYWGISADVQWLANRGYAVLQVNYRGSAGFGKAFINAGDKQWGVGRMQHDLTDSVHWAVSNGIADPHKVCIMGGSYGGYASLAGLAFTPDLYRCGVDLVGISNVGTFMKSIPAYWKPLKYELITRVGDAENDQPLNRNISPLYHVDKMTAPLLIGQGANDVRVPKAESDQIFRALKGLGRDVQYVVYTDEGHGLVRPENRLDYFSRVEQFLAKHLGGRNGPLFSPKGSSAQVITV